MTLLKTISKALQLAISCNVLYDEFSRRLKNSSVNLYLKTPLSIVEDKHLGTHHWAWARDFVFLGLDREGSPSQPVTVFTQLSCWTSHIAADFVSPNCKPRDLEIPLSASKRFLKTSNWLPIGECGVTVTDPKGKTDAEVRFAKALWQNCKIHRTISWRTCWWYRCQDVKLLPIRQYKNVQPIWCGLTANPLIGSWFVQKQLVMVWFITLKKCSKLMVTVFAGTVVISGSGSSIYQSDWTTGPGLTQTVMSYRWKWYWLRIADAKESSSSFVWPSAWVATTAQSFCMVTHYPTDLKSGHVSQKPGCLTGKVSTSI